MHYTLIIYTLHARIVHILYTHYTLHTTHYTRILHTIYYTLLHTTLQCALHAIHCKLHTCTAYYTLHTITHYTLHTTHVTHYILSTHYTIHGLTAYYTKPTHYNALHAKDRTLSFVGLAVAEPSKLKFGGLYLSDLGYTVSRFKKKGAIKQRGARCLLSVSSSRSIWS